MHCRDRWQASPPPSRAVLAPWLALCRLRSSGAYGGERLWHGSDRNVTFLTLSALKNFSERPMPHPRFTNVLQLSYTQTTSVASCAIHPAQRRETAIRVKVVHGIAEQRHRSLSKRQGA